MAELTGVPYQNVKWQDIDGQPFGVGVGYNGMILGNLESIVDMEGPVAVQGNVTSNRGMSIGFGRMGKQTLPYSATDVRFLSGGNVDIADSLTVTGNVLTARDAFKVGSKSTYIIGSDASANQRQTLAQLYAANGSPYWEPAQQGTNYLISSYDVPRRIPAARVGANVPAFFSDARKSFEGWMNFFASLKAEGETRRSDYGYRLTGTNPLQNLFDLEWPKEGSIVGNIALNVPKGSVNIVRIYSGEQMTVSTPLWGEDALAKNTIFVLMNARSVRLDFPTAIYGSVFAPDTQWNAFTTGGNINGNAVLSGLWVQQGSGFELHWFPFAGGIVTGAGTEEGEPSCPACPTCPPQKECPACPACPTCPPQKECPACPACPTCPPSTICPSCPPQKECPVCPACPACPPQKICPACPTCPTCPPCPVCPPQKVCPACPTCPPCPVCPPQKVCPACPTCPPCPAPFITPGVIAGCITACGQCQWRVKLYDTAARQTLSVWQHCGSGCFSFEASAAGTYALEIENCNRYLLTLSNVGVQSLCIRK
ncbi:MAG: choice-of-anchor A family protein [Clostridia bacterium]